MSKDQEVREKVFDEIWCLFKSFEDILIKAKLPPERSPDATKLYPIIQAMNINKLTHGLAWLKKFEVSHIHPWKKLRAENTEQYWAGLELMNFGNQFIEIKMLNDLSKNIRRDWFTAHNVLVMPKKEHKKETKETKNK